VDLDKDQLIMHALEAIKSSSVQKISALNVCVGVVGPDQRFHVLENDDIAQYVDQLVQDEQDEKKMET
jgi:20S proteasome alpha/beta subunit